MDGHLQARQIKLNELHARIDACWVCKEHVCLLKKPQGLRRGVVSSIMIVGQAPGNREFTSRSAFAGQSGTRLDKWLVKCGADPNNPRELVYCTSVVKCVSPNPTALRYMIHNCRHFLDDQISTIQPRLIITMGEVAYYSLALTRDKYADALCKIFKSEDYLLMTASGQSYKLLPWPHPSGLNRWLNDPHNSKLLEESFNHVRPYYASL